MKLIKISVLALTLATLVMVSGCTDRGVNSGGVVVSIEGGVSPLTTVVFPRMMTQILNEFQLIQATAYIPKVAYPIQSGGEGRAVPMLVLLPPQDGDEYFYLNAGLKEIADELISTGEIEPMIVVTLENDQVFGGYFYGGSGRTDYVHVRSLVQIGSGTISGSPAAGAYDEIIGDQLIEFLNERLLTPIDDRTQRGIGGVGMGAYGAFRAAMKHPDAFSSISVSDGPLDFDGSDGNSGLISLVPRVFDEQNLTSANFENFRSGSGFPVSRLFIGGSLAFSPNDTALACSVVVIQELGVERNDVRIWQRYTLADSTTFVEDVVTPEEEDLDFHLPFDANGQIYAPIWSMWMEHDLEYLLDNEPGATGAFTDARVWIATSDQAKWGFDDMTESWISTLDGDGYIDADRDVKEYSGYAGFPAYNSQYIYDLLRDMLIFHDRSFRGLPQEDASPAEPGK